MRARSFIIDTAAMALNGLRTRDLANILARDEYRKRAEQAEAEQNRLKAAIGKLLTAEGRILDDWAESSSERRRELWRNLHEAADEVRDELDQPGEPPCPT